MRACVVLYVCRAGGFRYGFFGLVDHTCVRRDRAATGRGSAGCFSACGHYLLWWPFQSASLHCALSVWQPGGFWFGFFGCVYTCVSGLRQADISSCCISSHRLVRHSTRLSTFSSMESFRFAGCWEGTQRSEKKYTCVRAVN